MLLCDRHGWRWNSTATIWGFEGPRLDLFPPLETESVSALEIRRDTQWLGGATLTVPSAPVSPRSTIVSQVPFDCVAGPLSLRVKSFEAVPLATRPSRARLDLRYTAEWNGRPCLVRIAEMTIIDAMGRGHAPTITRDGRITTHLSPHIDWNVQVVVWRADGEPLEEEETFVFEPQVGPDAPLQQWDREVSGTGWRVLFSPGTNDIVFPRRFPGPPRG